jgi:rhodanese-related sulfurtransferase
MDRIVTVEKLHGKWQEIQAGKSKAVLLDVRTPAEYESGRIPGARNIPSDRPALVREYWPDPETEIWLYCRTQRRSMDFASYLYRNGYRNVYVMEGGILGWAEKGYPLSKP